ncbi:MAG: hypothetical protein JSS26_20095 [Nitrospira sp.]|nr:hypothetical protein [Nitrospira sp.]
MLRRQRIAAFFTFTILIICCAPYFFGWSLIGQSAKPVAALATLAATIEMQLFGPSIWRLRAYQRLKRMRASQYERSIGA